MICRRFAGSARATGSPGWLWRARRSIQRLWRSRKTRVEAELELGDLTHEGPVADDTSSVWLAVFRLAKPFFFDPDTRLRAIGLVIALIVLLVLESSILVAYSEVQKKYMTALQEKRADGFYSGLWAVAGIIAMIIPTIGIHSYVQRALDIEWRAKVTRKLAQTYLAGNREQPAFYSMHLDGSVDNPDQRICQDTADLVSSSISLLVDTCGSAFRVIGFIGILYRISPRVCVGIVGYVFICTSVALLGFAPRIFKYQQMCTKQEATLRYCLIRVRENAESVAFFRGGYSEWLRYDSLFAGLIQTIYDASAVACGFSMFRSGTHYLTFAVPALLVGPAYLSGEAEFGTISQVQFAFSIIFNALMLILDKLNACSAIAVQVSRLRELEQAIHGPDKGGSSREKIETIDLHQSNAKDEQVLVLEDMTLMTPARRGCMQRTLVQNLKVQLSVGQSMLIVGSSGIGKSSLLRGIAGLWTAGWGRVHRCSGDEIFFMPQRPYMCLGSLREQLLYPDVHRTDVVSDSLREVLRDVNLGYIADQYRLDETQEWGNVLSLGEQQRVNFARMLLRPSLRLALIDEGTSACDPPNEAHLYELLKRRKHSYVSVGHRPSLRQYHTHMLLLERFTAESSGAQPPTAGEGCYPAIPSFSLMEDFEKNGSCAGRRSRLFSEE